MRRMSRHHSRRKRQVVPQKNQVPHLFRVDERVLCYEPDKNKARVLYDSKVLEAVERTDNKGKITVEYKIHFFGWNSSWDRYVAEDCVLKDTDENRALQKDLKAKADVLLQAHLKKKKRKKTLTEILKEATKEKSKSSKTGHREDGGAGGNNTSGSESSDESSEDEEERKITAQIFLTPIMKHVLERDYAHIRFHDMLVTLPAEYTVAYVFEKYVKFIGFRELHKIIDRRKASFMPGVHPSVIASTLAAHSSYCVGVNSKQTEKGQVKTITEAIAEDIAKISRKVRQAQEVVYGLKTIFDFMLYQLLLYDEENSQFLHYKEFVPKMPTVDCSRMIINLTAAKNSIMFESETSSEQKPKVKKEPGGAPAATTAPSTSTTTTTTTAPSTSATTTTTIAPSTSTTTTTTTTTTSEPPTAEQPLASEPKPHCSTSVTNQPTAAPPPPALLQPPPPPTPAPGPIAISKAQKDAMICVRKIDRYVKHILSWRYLPEECYTDPDPCVVYGLPHLFRLFVKLPDIFNRTLIPRRKLKLITHHINQMVDHIESTYSFSTSRMYVSLSLNRPMVFPSEERNVNPPPPPPPPPRPAVAEAEKYPEVKIEVGAEGEATPSTSRRNRPSTSAADRPRPRPPKLVMAPVAVVTEALEEHQLRVSNENICAKDAIKICNRSPVKEITKKNTKRVISTATATAVNNAQAATNEDVKPKLIPPIIKQEPNSSPIKTPAPIPSRSQTERRSVPVPKVERPESPPLSMARKMRKSAADSAFRTAHMFASLQNAPPRSTALLNPDQIKREPEDEPVSRKRSLSTDAPCSEPKRVTRIVDRHKDTTRRQEGGGSRRTLEGSSKRLPGENISDQEPKASTSRSGRQQIRSPTRPTTVVSTSKSPTRREHPAKVEKDKNSDRKIDSAATPRRRRRTNSSPRNSRSVSPVRKSQSASIERKILPARRMMAMSKKSSPPRISKSHSFTKEPGSPSKSPHKTGSQPSTTLRLRSRSDERQLRSKGALINALSLPIVNHRSPSKPKEDHRSPGRRDSCGHASGNLGSSGSSKLTNDQQHHNRRRSRK